MTIGHLAPFGPIAATAERHWRPAWPRWTRALPWAAALAGCLFPDLDVVANVLLTGRLLHMYYLPHSVLPYLPVVALGWLLSRWQRTRIAGLTVLTFGASNISHLLLDVVSHGTTLLYPLWPGLVGWTYPARTGESVFVAYLRSPNVLLEVGVLIAAAAWWLRRHARVRRRVGGGAIRKPTLGYLRALPRHEGSRLLQLDGTCRGD